MRLRVWSFLILVSVPLFAGRAPAVTVKVPSKVLGTARPVLVSLPEGYERAKERYPVLYMTDGDRHLPLAAAAADALASVDRMPPLIIVAIPHADRTRDLTPTHGGFGRFVAGELIPTIESRYRTAPYRIFAGHSLGGLLGLDLFAADPALFHAWLIVSPATAWGDGFIFRRVQELRVPAARPMLLLMQGSEGEEMASGVERLRAQLATRGFAPDTATFPDDDHVTVAAPAYYTGLRRVFKPWFFRILDSDDPDELSTRIVKHYEELSARYGYTIPIPQYRLERIRKLRERQ